MFEFVNDFNELKEKTINYRYCNYGGKLLVVQGYKDILRFDENEVILKLKSGEIQVQGVNLVVCDISSNYVTIKGNILNVSVEGVDTDDK